MLGLGLRNGEVARKCSSRTSAGTASHSDPKSKWATARRPSPLSDRVIALLKAISQKQSEKAGIFLSRSANVLWQ